MQIDYFDLLCDEPIYIENVGCIHIPKLLDIKHLGYKNYDLLRGYLSIDLKNFLEIAGLTEEYDKLTEERKEKCNLFNLMMNTNEFKEMYQKIYSFFISEDVFFDEDCQAYHFIELIEQEEDNDKDEVDYRITGIIDETNFEMVRRCLLQVNYLISQTEEPKYKNDRARKIAEKLAMCEKLKKSNKKDDLDFPHMISKYCADNNNGINILNVWDMTIYQFYDQFSQHNYIRQINLQDMIYANTVNISDTKSYDTQLWLKK
jgi:hypothetical protein